jgi:hypothetical protein
MFAGGSRWLSLAVDGRSGASRGHAPVVRRPGSRWGGAVERPSAFQVGHIPSWRGSCESYALSPVADDSGWLLLLLSPLLSAVGPVLHFRGLPADDSVTPWSLSPSPGLFPAIWPGPVLSQAPPPNPIAAEPDGSRVLSGGGGADHEVTPKAPLTGSGCREQSNGGFGGGHPHFHPHAPDLLIRRSGQIVQDSPSLVVRWAVIPQLSAPVSRRPVSWQQCWQQPQGRGRRSMSAPAHIFDPTGLLVHVWPAGSLLH